MKSLLLGISLVLLAGCAELKAAGEYLKDKLSDKKVCLEATVDGAKEIPCPEPKE